MDDSTDGRAHDAGGPGSPPGAAASPPLDPELNESSPLLSPTNSDRPYFPTGRTSQPIEESQETKGLWYMIMLTISLGGLQVAWSAELSNGSPYLLSLGLDKSLMALVWIAGPLTGTLVVPYVGVVSDNSRNRWGKRRPFMVGGTVATIFSLLFLSWARETVGGTLGLFGANPDSKGVKITVIAAAVVGIYVLDVSINTVQAAIRAFMVDCAPAHQQEEANSMASRILGLGNIAGYVAGYVNLPAYLWFLGDNQFKILCAIASICLGLTIALSVVFVQERDPRTDGGRAPKKTPGVVAFFFHVYKTVRRLPPQTKRVCQVQFCAWVGFFPLLFYTSSYVGEIYVQPYLEANPHMTPEELEALYEQATRVGTFALLVNAIVSLSTNFFLPFFIAPTFDNQPVGVGGAGTTTQQPRRSWTERLRIPGFTLRRAWIGSLVLFAGCMFCTVLARSVAAATTIIGIAGVTWAMTLWAPWAIISAEISHRDVAARAKKLRTMASDEAAVEDTSGDDDLEPGRQEDTETDQAGVILGVHNMALAVPQMIATVGSSIVFRFIQKPRGTPGDHSFAIVMALGGLFVLASCVFAFSIRDDARAGAADEGEQGEALLGR